MTRNQPNDKATDLSAETEASPTGRAFISAANSGDIEVVSDMIRRGISEALRSSALGSALFYGKLKVAEVLLSAGISARMVQYRPLHSVARHGAARFIRPLVTLGLDPNEHDSNGRTPTALAASEGHIEVIQELLAVGARGDGKALVAATVGGYAEIVELLISAGANLREIGEDGISAIEYASYLGHDDIYRMLDKAGAADRTTSLELALFRAADAGDAAAVQSMHDQGVNLNAKRKKYNILNVNIAPKNSETPGLTALMMAAQGGHVEVVRLLLSLGADTTVLSDAFFIPRRTAALCAAMGGSVGAMKALMDAGADLYAREINMYQELGGTCLHVAAQHGRDEVVQFLIENGFDPDGATGGPNPLCNCAKSGSTQAAKALLDHGAKIDARLRDGSTPLIVACGNGQVEMVRFLLDRGANPRLKTRQFGGPIHAALVHASVGVDIKTRNHRALECIRLLLENGADPNESDRDKQSALSAAAGNFEHMQLLLAAGADALAVNKKGEDVLFWAAVHSNIDAVKMLLSSEAYTGRIQGRREFLADRLSDDPRWHEVQVLINARAAEPDRGPPTIPAKKVQKPPGQSGHKPSRKPTGAKKSTAGSDLGEKADSDGFRSAIELLEKLAGKKGERSTAIPGFAVCLIEGDPDDFVNRHREEFLKLGTFVFHWSHSMAMLQGVPIGILPTTDQLEAVSAMGTGGPNYDIGTTDVIRCLKRVEKNHARFEITAISHDTLVCRFASPLKNVKALAKLIYKICPDVVEQGTETVEELENAIRNSNSLSLWWD